MNVASRSIASKFSRARRMLVTHWLFLCNWCLNACVWIGRLQVHHKLLGFMFSVHIYFFCSWFECGLNCSCHLDAQTQQRPAEGGSAKELWRINWLKLKQECKMEQKHLSSQSKVQPAVFIYTESIMYIVCFSYLFILCFCLDCPSSVFLSCCQLL